MPEFNFKKIHKSKIGTGNKMRRSLRLSYSSLSLSGDLFGDDRHVVKFDVDTETKAIRVRPGTEGGSRSYVLSASKTGSAISAGTPIEIKKLMDAGKLPMGTYTVVKENAEKKSYILAYDAA